MSACSVADVNLEQYFNGLRRRWTLIVAVFVIFGGLSLVLFEGTTKIYESKTRLIINSPSTDTSPYSVLTGLNVSATLLQSYAEIATSQSTIDDVRSRLGIADSDHFSLGAHVESGTLFIQLTAKDTSPLRAQQIAAAEAASLTQSAEELAHGITQKVTSRVIDPATLPTVPYSPRPSLSFAIYFLVSTLISVFVVVIAETFDRSIRSIHQARNALGLTSLVSIGYRPQTNRRPLVALRPADPFGEPFRALRTAIRFGKDDSHVQTLLITSPGEGEGKTSTAANLALAMAQAGERVCLVDADLRRSAVAKIMRIDGSKGLTDILVDGLPFENCIQSLHNVDVLPAGGNPPNPSELLGSEAFADLLDDLASRYDIVIVDAPPGLPVTDAVVLSTQVDAVIIVVRYGSTKIAEATKIAEVLSGVDANMTGFVLNAVRGKQGQYYNYGTN